MIKKIKHIILILLILITGIACVSRKVSITGKEGIKKYNESAFDYLYAEALKQKLLGNSGEAIKYLEQCIKISPANDAAYYQIAQILTGSGDLINAKFYAKKAYSIDCKNIWYMSLLSGLYYQQSDIDSAIIIYEKAIEDYPQKQNLFLTLAGLYNQKKEYSKAVNIYKTLEKKYGVNENTTPGYIESLTYDGKFDEALRKTEELISLYPSGIQYYAILAEIYRHKGDTIKAQDVYNKLLNENPNDPQLLLSVSDFLLSQKKYDDLLLLLNNVIVNGYIKKEDKISLFAKLINEKFNNKDQDNNLLLALMVFESTYENDDIVCLLRPEFLSNIGKVDDAITRLKEVVKQRPNNYYGWEKLLLLYLQKKDFNNLFITGEEVATRFNRSFLAKILYANAAIEKKNYDVAKEELRKAEILAGDNNELLLQLLTMRADLYYKTGEYNKAYEAFDKALIINSEDLTILNNYAYYLAEQGEDLKRAEEMALRVVEKEKDNSTFLDTYAWVLYKRAKYKDAAQIMEKIINKDSENDAEYLEHYGYILKMMKDCKKAVIMWQKAIESDNTKTNLETEIKNCTGK